jgi:hypothetical protein
LSFSANGDKEAEGGRSVKHAKREMVSTKKEAALEWREQTLFLSRNTLIISLKNRKIRALVRP